MANGALFNEERTHRQRLWRIWDADAPLLIVVGMNPSQADEINNDNTVEQCQRRAQRRGYGGLMMLNMQDVIETDSRKLRQMPAEHRCTAANSAELVAALDSAQAEHADILCAWGGLGQRYGPIDWFTAEAALRNVTLFCLMVNADGSPHHPLYVAYTKDFEWFGGVVLDEAGQPLVPAE